MKVINPLDKGGYEIHSMASHGVFVQVSDLKQTILSSCEQYIQEDIELQFGYILPGHGKKGKQVLISSNEDLQNMYESYKKKKQILLWVKQTKKRPRIDASATSGGASAQKPGNSSKYDKQVDKMAQLEEIVDKLQEKHSDQYTMEQLRAWADVIQLGRHHSYDTAPNKRYFKTGKGVGSTAIGVSPGKRLNMRSECIDQIEKWHRLMEKGAISSEQYQEIQDNIMSDIKEM